MISVVCIGYKSNTFYTDNNLYKVLYFLYLFLHCHFFYCHQQPFISILLFLNLLSFFSYIRTIFFSNYCSCIHIICVLSYCMSSFFSFTLHIFSFIFVIKVFVLCCVCVIYVLSLCLSCVFIVIKFETHSMYVCK